jgi:aspartyl-tRNA(Asn)/glutamyl-tRNA(Gln) amidotransferase subunit A
VAGVPYQGVSGLSLALKRGEISSEELTRNYLARIQRLDARLNAFITVTEDLALTQARAADRRLAAGNSAPLTGIPIAHKDIFCTAGVRTTCGSRMLENFISPYDATVVARLTQEGMVLIGKTNMDEFAMGSSNETSYFGPVRNPWDTDRVPGGSSGGSAAAVAAGLTPVATGTDTGGSIRQPAALCGVTGLKPTYGRVSRYGMIAFASSLDQAGPLGRSAEDVAHVLQAISGVDSLDSTSVDCPVDDYVAALDESIDGLRIGFPTEQFAEGLDAGVQSVIEDALKQFETLGATLVEIALPTLRYSVPAYYVVAPAECSSNLSRFDGVRFGYRASDAATLEEMYKRTRAEGFGREVKRRIMIGTYTLSAGYYDAYYLKAQQVRESISREFQAALSEVDVIMGPTSPSVAFRFGERSADPVKMYLSDIYTIAANLAGLPAISIPAGFCHGLPVGLQIVGRHLDEVRLLAIAHRFQADTDWHLRSAPGFE